MLVATICIGFVLAVAFLALASAESVPFPAAGLVVILFTLDVVALLALVGYPFGDVGRKPPDRGI